MKELFQFDWRAIDWLMTFKVSAAFVIMLVLAELTGESWMATALAAMFAWFANLGGGPLKQRVIGMTVFGIAGVLITLLTAVIGLDLLPNVIAIAVISFVCTYAMRWGGLAFMTGFGIICWAIYQPFLVEATSVLNCVTAVITGTVVVMGLNVFGDLVWPGAKPEPEPDPAESAPAEPGPDLSYITAYSLIVAVVLALTTWYGWSILKTDPTLMVGGAYFIFGPDPRKTWIAGISRAVGMVLGALVGLGLAHLIGPGLLLTALMILFAGLSFGAFAAHPGAWMFFFMIFAAMGWPSLEPEVFSQVANERLYGELVGIALAMLGLVFLQYWQNRRQAL